MKAGKRYLIKRILLLTVIAAGLFWLGEAGSRPVGLTYYLPLEYGDSRKIFQGNGGTVSHDTQWNRYAWDFSPMPEGTPVVAAADGVVTCVKEDTAGPTGDWHDNNMVIIRHADGNVSENLHIKQNGVLVEKGQRVMRGDLVAYSGNTGNSGGPHLHFNLRRGNHVSGVSVPCKFADQEGRYGNLEELPRALPEGVRRDGGNGPALHALLRPQVPRSGGKEPQALRQDRDVHAP